MTTIEEGVTYEWRWDGPNPSPDCECPCGECLRAVGYDPETPCPDCPVHGGMSDAELDAEWKQRTETDKEMGR